MFYKLEINDYVSIHTPTKGVTRHLNLICSVCHVSIHTPTKGVTLTERPRVHGESVSIHTPTKGVTRFESEVKATYFGFNPHTHEGCDL